MQVQKDLSVFDGETSTDAQPESETAYQKDLPATTAISTPKTAAELPSIEDVSSCSNSSVVNSFIKHY